MIAALCGPHGQSNDESWLCLDKAPGTTLCERLCFLARSKEVAVEALRRKA
ncbi:hypothetical protein DPMN_069035 [Dreissena polymorpha]|uniref:Uncharacterized protein n=1 Tax=Dreissena polymorpha TaxID=45954 RepID=A0A9D3Z295_DREPO|nr:hypothetical protein DPMN_069035 [Dreissena polymorpha]